MAGRPRGVGPEKVAEFKLLYDRGWLSNHCTEVLSRRGGIPLSVIPNRKDRPVGARTKRRKEARRAQAAWNAQQNTLTDSRPRYRDEITATPPPPPPPPPFPIPGGCDVMLSGPIVANPPGTPIEAPAAMRPDSPAAPKPPHPTSLRGRVETLLASWESDRSKDIAAADDQTLPDEVRAAARRAANIGGIYIEELDAMYHEYVTEIAS